MASLDTFEKQPSERLDYDVDFERFFDESDLDEVATVVSCTVSGTGSAPDLSVDGSPIPLGDPTRRVKVWLEDGVSGTTYKVTLIVLTDNGRKVETDFLVKVKER